MILIYPLARMTKYNMKSEQNFEKGQTPLTRCKTGEENVFTMGTVMIAGA